MVKFKPSKVISLYLFGLENTIFLNLFPNKFCRAKRLVRLQCGRTNAPIVDIDIPFVPVILHAAITVVHGKMSMTCNKYHIPTFIYNPLKLVVPAQIRCHSSIPLGIICKQRCIAENIMPCTTALFSSTRINFTGISKSYCPFQQPALHGWIITYTLPYLRERTDRIVMISRHSQHRCIRESFEIHSNITYTCLLS